MMMYRTSYIVHFSSRVANKSLGEWRRQVRAGHGRGDNFKLSRSDSGRWGDSARHISVSSHLLYTTQYAPEQQEDTVSVCSKHEMFTAHVCCY